MATSTIKGIYKTDENITGFTFRLQNGIVYVGGYRHIDLNAGSYAYIGTLSEPFRPKAGLWLPIVIDPNGSRVGIMKIDANGSVSLLSNVAISGANAIANGSYSVL